MPKTCVICEGLFDPNGTVAICCSPKCSRIRKTQNHAAWVANNRDYNNAQHRNYRHANITRFKEREREGYLKKCAKNMPWRLSGQRKQPELEERLCERCSNNYTPTGNSQKFCPDCRTVRKKEYNAEYLDANRQALYEQKKIYYNENKHLWKEWKWRNHERHLATKYRHAQKYADHYRIYRDQRDKQSEIALLALEKCKAIKPSKDINERKRQRTVALRALKQLEPKAD